MTIQDVSMLPLEEDVAGTAGVVRNSGPRPGLVRRWVVLAGVVLGCGGLSGDAVSWADTLDKRRTGSLFNDLAEPPPTFLNRMQIRTQSDDAAASFFFKDVDNVWHTADSAESSQNFFIHERAAINTDAGTTLHLSGTIANELGSTQGLAKLGAGTLVLSGNNTYKGNTLLLQGQLQVAGKAALGPAYASMLEANTGTVLNYVPGVIVQNRLQMQAMDIASLVPAGSYAPIVPDVYADSVQLAIDGGEAIQLGDMFGSAPLVKQGSGLWRFAGLAGGYTGLFTVNQGTLAVDGLFLGPVRVNSGARLQGNGVIGATTVQAGGTLAPGNSIGALTVVGDLVFKPDSRFEIDASPDGTADFVSVERGKALLAGDVLVLPEHGDWQASTSYPVLYAEGGLDNTRFDSVSTGQEFAFLTPSLSYEDNDRQVSLTLSRNATPFEEVAETPNELAVAKELEQDKPPIYEQVLVLDRPQARMAFQQLSNSWSASIRSSLLDDTRFLREAVLTSGSGLAIQQYVTAATRSLLRAGGVSLHSGATSPLVNSGDAVPFEVASDSHGSRFWSHAFHSSADRAQHQGIPADDRSIHGMVLGMNHSINDGLSGGGFVGAQRSDLRRGHGQANAGIDSSHVGINMAGRWKELQFALGAAHTWHTVKSRRNVTVKGLEDTLVSRYSVRNTQVFGEISWPVPWQKAPPKVDSAAAAYTAVAFNHQGDPGGRPDANGGLNANGLLSTNDGLIANGLLIEPFARVAWVNANNQGFIEQGGDAALNVRPARDSVLFSTAGLRLTHLMETATGTARLQGQLAWRHAGGAVRSVARQTFRDSAQQTVFDSEGQPLARSAWQLELGLAATLSKNAVLGMAYAGQYARRLQDHGIRMSVAMVF